MCACALDWAERLLEVDGRPCDHDGVGNLVRLVGPNGESAFAFDGASALSAARTRRGCVDYCHDGEGRLVSRRSADGVTRYLPDPTPRKWRPLLAVDASAKKTFYIWDGGVVVAAL